jgi:hypothetical protein
LSRPWSTLVDLAAQKADERLDIRRVVAEAVIPDSIEELRPRQHPLGVEQQIVQQPVLRRRQAHGSAGARDPVRVLVQFEIGVTKHRRPLPATGAAREQPAASSSTLNGLVRYSSPPIVNPRTRSVAAHRAVRKMTGAATARLLSCSHIAKPSASAA